MNKNARLCRFALQRTIITALLVLVWVAGQAQNIKWCLEGTVDNAAPNDTLTIIDSERHQPIATIQVKNGAIVPASGVLEKPAVCRIAKKGRRGSIGIFVLEEGTTKISIDLDKAYVLKVGGTPVNNDLATFIDEQNRRTDNHAAYRENMYRIVSDIVEKHPDHVLSPYLIDWCQLIFTPTQSLRLIDMLSPELQLTPNVERRKEILLIEQETEVGKMFKEMTGTAPDGKSVRLSDFVGKGNYVLADFWASWCGPCKAEMPHVIELYEQYKDKGLQLIGITVDDTPEKSDAIVKENGLTFPQIYESKPMSTYGVTAIPYTILFAPDGTILARGPLPMLEKKMAEIFEE